MPRRALPLALALLACPAQAAEGVFVWNDPAAMAIRMATFDSADPATVTGMKTLAELTSLSSTMTGVAADGEGIGLCRQEQDGNEAPAWLFGFDRQGQEIWRQNGAAYLTALESVLPAGLATGRANSPSWFTFECKDAGASGEAGVLAFDLGFSAGKPDAEGFLSGKVTDFVGRLHVEAKTGKVLAVALVKKGKSALVLQPNPKSRTYTDDTGQTFQLGNESSIQLPKGGKGRVMWGDRPFRWNGEPVVEGFDFAWFLPQSD